MTPSQELRMRLLASAIIEIERKFARDLEQARAKVIALRREMRREIEKYTGPINWED